MIPLWIYILSTIVISSIGLWLGYKWGFENGLYHVVGEIAEEVREKLETRYLELTKEALEELAKQDIREDDEKENKK